MRVELPGFGDRAASSMSAASVAKAAAEKRQAAAGDVPASPAGSVHLADGPEAPKPPSTVVGAKSNEARGRKKKPLHWAKVPKNLVGNSFWATLEDSLVPLNEGEIDELFGMDSRPALEIAAEEVRPEVLAHKRKHNINILLANLKMGPDAIKDVVRQATYKEMEPTTLQGLLLVCPTAEEEELLRNNANIKDQVDKTDAFMMELAELRGLRGKILCALSAKTFNEEAVDVIRNMDTFAMIPIEIQNSKKLRTALECVLALGNFLNSGTGRGGAHGFKLEALAMLSTVKDVSGDTLLDYLVRVLETSFPGTLPLDDMPTLARSAEISLDAIGEEVQGLLDSVANVGEQIKAIGDDPVLAGFLAEMTAFSEEAIKVREEIVSLRALMMDKLQGMMGHFGERNKAARGRQEDILRMLREFSSDTAAAHGRYKEKGERAAKKAEKEATKGGIQKESSHEKDEVEALSAPIPGITDDVFVREPEKP